MLPFAALRRPEPIRPADRLADGGEPIRGAGGPESVRYSQERPQPHSSRELHFKNFRRKRLDNVRCIEQIVRDSDRKQEERGLLSSFVNAEQ